MVDFYRFKKLEDCSECIHAVTTKRSLEPYAFSLALHTGEDEKAIVSNREKLSLLLNTEQKLHFIVANQTHSNHITMITQKETKGWRGIDDAVEDCDALITDQKGVILAILTADCVPLLLHDHEKGVVAAIHAGWKGTQAEIAAKTVEKMIRVYGCDSKDIIAGIAPAIGRCCYEVGEDVAKHFFKEPLSFDKVGKKYMMDLPYLNRKQLIDTGIREENIEMSGICTACEVERFFSYRKEQGCSGRFMSMIGLSKGNL